VEQCRHRALNVHLKPLVAWYAARDVPSGVGVPAEWDVPIGQPTLTKRCFGLPLTAALPPPRAAGIQVQHAGVADFDAYVATDAALFGDGPVLTVIRALLLQSGGEPTYAAAGSHTSAMPSFIVVASTA
jgi:hypothetical protein